MLGSVDNLKYCIRNYPTINPVTVVPYHLASHRREDLERGHFIVHPFHRSQLMFVENLRSVLVELWSRLVCIVCLIILSLLFLLLFLLLHVAICHYFHCFLALLALCYRHYCCSQPRSRTWALCWPSSRHLPGNEIV